MRIVLLVAATFCCACTTWRVASLEPQQFSEAKSPSEVRLTLKEGTAVTVSYPVIVGDSLVWEDEAVGHERDAARRAIPVSSIRQVEVHRIDGGATFGLLILLGGALTGLLVFLSAVSKGD
jgi:hypothetical protein